jgi:hypothetical protein
VIFDKPQLIESPAVLILIVNRKLQHEVSCENNLEKNEYPLKQQLHRDQNIEYLQFEI